MSGGFYSYPDFPGASYDHWKTTPPDDSEEYDDEEPEREPDYEDLESLDEAFKDHLAICASRD